jgi:hypothetical protein
MSTMPPTDNTPSRSAFPGRLATLITLAVLTLPYVAGLAVAAMLAWASPLIILDGPADTGASIAFLTLCTCPFAFALGLVGGWLCFFLRRYRLALILAALPLMEGIVLLIAGLVFKGQY